MRRQSRFVTLVLLIVIASYALDVRSQQSAGRPYAYIPETVSPEWQERLRSMEDPGKGPGRAGATRSRGLENSSQIPRR
jgi:hypothetical protein